MHFCTTVGRPVTVASINYGVIKSFHLQFKALWARKKEDPREVTTVSCHAIVIVKAHNLGDSKILVLWNRANETILEASL